MAGGKILVVDDNADLREMLQTALEQAGYCVLEADNGLRALDVLGRVEPNLVLIDVNMPVMSGPQFVETLRARSEARRFGIVTMSGSIYAQSSPTQWFLPKPVDLGLLLQIAGHFCGRGETSPFWVRHARQESSQAFATMAKAAQARARGLAQV